MSNTKSTIKPIVIQTPNLGGISDSPYIGIKNSLASIVGFDLHSIPGVFLVNQKMTREPGSPTNDYYKIVPCSDGNIYFFGKNTGNVWKRQSNGSYVSVGTTSPAAGSGGVLDAIEYNGFIYYSMQSRLGQWNFASAFSGRNDNFGTFTNGSATDHPIYFLPNAQYIFIGDVNVLAQVDNTNTFVANALTTIAKNLRITTLGSQGSNLYIGASAESGIANSYVLCWNTWSPDVSPAYPVHEPFINAFLPIDDQILVSAGLSGKLYQLDPSGSFLQAVKQIPAQFPNIYSPTFGTVFTSHQAVASKQGIPLFGVGTNTGNNVALNGIYSYGRRGGDYPNILTLEYPISTGNILNIILWSLATVNTDVYCSSFDTNTQSFQIDKVDWNNKISGAYFETQIIRFSRVWLDNFYKFVTNLAQTLPDNTQVLMFYRINGGVYQEWTPGTDILSDTYRNSVTADRRVDARTLQVKVEVVSSGNNAPIIEDFIIFPE